MSVSTILDANQVIKRVYDEASGALKTIPSDQSSFAIALTAASGDNVATIPLATDTVVLAASLALNASSSTASVNILNNLNFCVVATWTGVQVGPNPTLTLQASIDNSVFVIAPGSSPVTMTTASGSAMFNVTGASYKHFRILVTPNSNSTGTAALSYVLKG
jgi:hypothetical protein